MHNKLTVTCVWVNGHVPFTAEYVTRLESMARRFLRRPFEFVCLTDRPWLLPGQIQRRIIQRPKGQFGWWSKVHLFNPAHHLLGRVIYLDLDTIIVSDLDPIVDYAAPFALAPHAGTFEGKDGLQVVKRFNSSVMVWNAGEQSRLFHDWSPKVAARLWGDQDWVGEQKPDAAAMPDGWFPRISMIQDGPIPAAAKVVLAKRPKNVEAAKRWPWVREAWA